MSKVARPHLLYIAWGFPPSRAGGVYRALATANAFAQAGWRVSVLTVEAEVFRRLTGADETLLDHVHPDVNVVRLPFPWPLRESNIATYSAFRVMLPPLWRRLQAWRDQREFPEVNYGPWLPTLNTAITQLHQTDPIDLTVATANPHVTFAAANQLWRDHQVPYVMDYRDAWLLDVFTGEQIASNASRQARRERNYVEGASEVWFVNDPILQWHSARYPQASAKFHTVANGWDPGLVSETSNSRPDAGSTARPLRFGYLGTVSPKVPMQQVLNGWVAAKHAGDLPEDAELVIGGYLGFFGTPQPDLVAQLDAVADYGVKYFGPVSKTQVSGFYAGLDALVLALGAGRYVTSGKVYEYLATGLPVISVHPKDNAASNVLEGYPRWFQPEQVSDVEVAKVFAAVTKQLQELSTTELLQQQLAAREFAAQYRRDRQLSPRVSALAKLVEGVAND